MNNEPLPDMRLRTGKKTDKTIVGMKRDEGRARKPMRKVSARQSARNIDLNGRFLNVLALMHDMYGTEFCQWPKHKRRGETDLVLDHVMTRQADNPDSYSNLGILCVFCNSEKGSRRIEYRPKEFIERLKELDGLKHQEPPEEPF